MQVRLNDKMKKELIDILELHKGYFGADVNHLIETINGVKAVKYISKESKDIIALVEKASGVSFSELKSGNRERNVVIARQYAFWRLYKHTYSLGYPLVQIGKMLNRDHSTVIHSIKKIEEGLSVNDFLVTEIHKRYEELEAESA